MVGGPKEKLLLMIGVATRLDPLPTTFDHPRRYYAAPQTVSIRKTAKMIAFCRPLGGGDFLAQRRKDVEKTLKKRGSALRLCAFAREISHMYIGPPTQ